MIKKYFSSLFELSNSASIIRAIIFTSGHIFIETIVISRITGARIELAGTAAIVGPLISGAWYWVIDRWWTKRHADVEHGEPGHRH
ncbi:MAG: hypothetical protein ACO25G_02920 [Holophagaceae bacterium]|jgi:hypothetical protein